MLKCLRFVVFSRPTMSLQVSINSKGLVYSVVLLLASVFLTVSTASPFEGSEVMHRVWENMGVYETCWQRLVLSMTPGFIYTANKALAVDQSQQEPVRQTDLLVTHINKEYRYLLVKKE